MKSNKLLTIFLIAFLLSCQNNNNRVELLVEVFDTQQNLSDVEVASLRLILTNPTPEEGKLNSDSADFANEDGSLITFPTDLTATIDKDLFGSLRVGVAAFDVEGKTLRSGFREVEIDAENDQVRILLNFDEEDSCLAGDGTDKGCCLNLIDDDQNGLLDCQDDICSGLPECRNIKDTCQNGVVDFFAGELCDDGNNEGGDGCSTECISEEFALDGVIRLFQGQTINSFGKGESKEGILATYAPFFGRKGAKNIAIESGSCQLIALSPEVLEGQNVTINADTGTLVLGPNGIKGAPTLQFGSPFKVGAARNLFIGGVPPLVEPGTELNATISGGLNFENPSPFIDIFPEEQLLVEIPETMERGKDYTITWEIPQVEGSVIASIEDTVDFTFKNIICEVNSSEGELIIPGELTQFFNQGSLSVEGFFGFEDLETGFVQVGDLGVTSGFRATVGLGFRKPILDDQGNPTELIFEVIHGLDVFGDVK